MSLMMSRDPRILLPVAFVLLMVGFILPVLMVMQMLPSTFFLNFFAYTASFLGLMLGIIGAVMLGTRRRKK